MRKTSKVLCLVGGIVSCVTAFACLGVGIFLIVLPNTPLFDEIIQDIITKEGQLPMSEESFKAMFVTVGIFTILYVFICTANAVFAFIVSGKEKPSTALLVINIVFGALSVYVNLAGGIVGLVANNREEQNQQ